MAAADDVCPFRFRVTFDDDDDELLIVESSASSVAIVVPVTAVFEFSSIATFACFEGDLAMVYWMMMLWKQ